MRSQNRIRMSLTSNSRSVGVNGFTTPKNDDARSCTELGRRRAGWSAMNHWKTAVAALRSDAEQQGILHALVPAEPA